MNYKLIMLPNPILVSDEEIKEGDFVINNLDFLFGKSIRNPNKGEINDKEYSKIIAGIEGLPKLDFSESVADILAKECGWVDVERLASEYERKEYDGDLGDRPQKIYKDAFKVAQSLNEKKWTDNDIKPLQQLLNEGYDPYDSAHHLQVQRMLKVIDEFIQSLSKPKEYNVKCIQEGNTIKVTKIL